MIVFYQRLSNFVKVLHSAFDAAISGHGALLMVVGEPEGARKHYDDALRAAVDMRFRPEIALTRLQLAELLLQHCPAEKAAAFEHLDFAIPEFRAMKMQPSLDRALQLR